MDFFKKELVITVLMPEAIFASLKLRNELLALFSQDYKPLVVDFAFERIKKMNADAAQAFFKNFFRFCLKSDIVILHHWLPQIPLDNFSFKIHWPTPESKLEEVLTPIKTPEQGTFRGLYEMACLAQHIKKIARQAILYSPIFGGSYLAPVHNYAEAIYSFHDSTMLQGFRKTEEAA